MGDACSIPLGFLAVVFGVSGWLAGYWPLWLPLLVFSPFIADATVTLLKRARCGEKLSKAHRSHYYQHLVQMGLAHMGQCYLLLGWGIIHLALMVPIGKYWQEYQSADKKIADA